MKVLIGIPCLMTGGTEIQTLNLVRALVAARHNVVVACYFEHAQAMVARYEAAGACVELLSQAGERPVGVFNTVKSLFCGLRQVVKRHKPDVAHVQYMAPGALAVLALRACGVRRIIATAHTPADIYPSLKLLHFIAKWVLVAFQCITLRAEQSFFGSSSLYEQSTVLRRRGNHFTIYNNLPDYIHIISAHRQFGESLTIGVVSRLEHIKGMDMVVPAFAKVHAQYPSTRLLVVGDGSMMPLMQQQVTAAGIADAVEFAGRQNQDALQGYYDRIDILLMPSRSEGFGLTAIEGMARGCVLVAANTGGLPEVVADGKMGLLHERENVEDIASKILTLVADTELTATMSRSAIQHVSHFSTEKYNQLIANLYSKIATI